MNHSEDELKSALRRQEPPEGFTQSVLVRIANQNSSQFSRTRHWLSIFTPPVLRWASAVTILVALIAGGVHYRQVESLKAQRERAEGEAAKQQLVLALRIAGTKLQLARSKVNATNTNQTKNRQVKE